jgi:hypothetical protein
MPWSAVLVMCALLVVTAIVMATQSVALAADGAFQLVRTLGSEDVYVPLDARVLAAWAHQGLVVAAVQAGVTDTQMLTLLLGVGQIVLPAVAWSLAIALSRTDRLVCATVAMVAALNAGATWFLSVNEVVQAAPLTTLVAVVLWQRRAWRWYHGLLALAASSLLVATYETALLTGALLTVWAVWRSTRPTGRIERYACLAVGALSLLSVLVAIAGSQVGEKPTHSQSLLYYLVSLEPWAFYVALGGIVGVTLGLGPWLAAPARRISLALGFGSLVVAVFGLEPGVLTGFQARGGAAVAAFALEAFLFWRWARRGDLDATPRIGTAHPRLAVAIPVLFVAAMVAVNVQPVRSWSQSLDAFRARVDATREPVEVDDALPADRRTVIWGWTSSSLSLLLRSRSDAGILVDRHPSLVPFAPTDARRQLDDKYIWGG